MTDSKAFKALELARTRLIVGNPFFGTLALNLTLIEEAGIPTMCTDGRYIAYNPEFVLSLDEEQLKGVNAHEVLHNVYKHFARRAHRDPQKWNIATDYRINYDLKEAGFTLPYKPCSLNELVTTYAQVTAAMKGKGKMPQPEKIHLYDKQFADMTAEEIYERLPDPPEQPGGGGTVYVMLDPGGGGTVYVMLDPGGCGGVMDAGTGPGAKQDADKSNDDRVNPEALANEWDSSVRMAVAVERAKQAGNLPGYLKRIIKDLKKPKVNWRDLLRQFIDNSISRDYTYQRPNRRGLSTGMILPGSVPDALSELVVFIDISGSISFEMATAMVSEAASALYDGVTDKMIVVYTDTDVACVDEFYPGDIVTAQARDGGGTHFQKAMEWLPKNAPDAACCIFLTDGETGSWGVDPGIPTLWGIYNTYERFPSFQPPFGTTIFVESPQ
jgi:predicted metal-dependent peptidase